MARPRQSLPGFVVIPSGLNDRRQLQVAPSTWVILPGLVRSCVHLPELPRLKTDFIGQKGASVSPGFIRMTPAYCGGGERDSGRKPNGIPVGR
jgi:hypothetical protein